MTMINKRIVFSVLIRFLVQDLVTCCPVGWYCTRVYLWYTVVTVIYWYCILLIGRPEELFVYIQFFDNVLKCVAFPFSIDKALV